MFWRVVLRKDFLLGWEPDRNVVRIVVDSWTSDKSLEIPWCVNKGIDPRNPQKGERLCENRREGAVS